MNLETHDDEKELLFRLSLRYRWKETDIAKPGSSFFKSQPAVWRGPIQRQTPASFLMTSTPPVTPAPVSQVEAADPGRSHPDPRSRPGVPRRRPTSPHPRLTSFSQASRSANPPSGWEHIPAITAGLAAPTHQPAKFSLARGVGFQRFPSPFPKPWNSLASGQLFIDFLMVCFVVFTEDIYHKKKKKKSTKVKRYLKIY